MNQISILAAMLFLGASFAFPAGAQASEKRVAARDTKAAAAATAAWTEGEVLRIDKGAGSVTIKHGPMPKFDMPAMAMPYRVKDRSALEQLKPGDRIRFDADSVDGVFTVTRLEKAK